MNTCDLSIRKSMGHASDLLDGDVGGVIRADVENRAEPQSDDLLGLLRLLAPAS